MTDTGICPYCGGHLTANSTLAKTEGGDIRVHRACKEPAEAYFRQLSEQVAERQTGEYD